jgi:uncharacterized membrane protein YbhN (UPF0104 family)
MSAPGETAATVTTEAELPTAELPQEFSARNLRRRTLQALAAIGVLVAVVLLAPGLGEVRGLLGEADPGWLALATALEGLSFASYVLMFGPIFCTGLTPRRSWQIGGSELAMGSLVPASGAGGLALGAWILYRGGMDGLAFGIFGPDLSLWLTALPAALAALAIVGVALLPRLGPGPDVDPDGSVLQRAVRHTRHAVIDGTGEARQILGSGDARVLAGAVGYWAFDNAVLWATFHAFGLSPPLMVILMGYLIGQLGGLLPLPGGIGGIDGGLIGTLIVYGAPAAGTAAAVLAYRVILFWLPLLAGGIAFATLRRDMPTSGELASCAPAIASQTA